MESQENLMAAPNTKATWWTVNSNSVSTSLYWLITRGVFIGIIIGLTLLVNQHFFAPRIVTVDVRSIITDEIAQAGKRGATDAERAVLADHFNAALDAELNALADRRTVVLVTPAVLRGGTDYTKEVQAHIRAHMEVKP